MSLLNNFLPLPHPIVEVQYLNPEMVPDLNEGKNSIVDVRCKDSHGRHFIVEMQIGKQGGFIKRVLLNTTKVYSRQLTKEQQFELAQPVYSLNLLDHRFDEDDAEWYHHYAFTNRNKFEQSLDEIHIVFIELPKWKKIDKFDLENIRDRWLLYFTKPNHFTMLSKEELDRFNEISEAIEVLEPTNFTPEQIRGYELYLDNIRTYVSTMTEAKREGRSEGIKEGISEGVSLSLSIIKELKEANMSVIEIAEKHNISIAKVEEIANALKI